MSGSSPCIGPGIRAGTAISRPIQARHLVPYADPPVRVLDVAQLVRTGRAAGTIINICIRRAASNTAGMLLEARGRAIKG